MDFKFNGVFFLASTDFEEMVVLTKEGRDPTDAFYEVASNWNYRDYCIAKFVKEDIIKEIKKRLDNETKM